MGEKEKEIIILLNKGYSCNQICNYLGITSKYLYDILVHLKTVGIEFQREYYSDGNVKLKKITDLEEILKSGKRINNRIITRPDEQEMKFLIISDIHLGSKFEGLSLLNESYNYCIKNGINIIYNTGDLVDGTFGQKEKSIVDPYLQIRYLIDKYPFDKNILNFCVGGDHDLSILENTGQNICSALYNYRPDIIMPSYTNAFVGLKNDSILLNHSTIKGKYTHKYDSYSMALIGHTHGPFKVQVTNRGNIDVLVPTLSKLTESIPSAIEMTVNFENGFIKEGLLRQVTFKNGKSYVISEIPFNFPPHNCNKIKNEFDYSFQKKIKR